MRVKQRTWKRIKWDSRPKIQEGAEEEATEEEDNEEWRGRNREENGFGS